MMHHAVYIWNRTPKKAIDMMTPYKKRYGKIPDISDFHIFGTTVYVKREKKPDKLSQQAIEGKWIGLEQESNRHWIYWPDCHSVTAERNVIFTNRQIQLIEGEQEDGNLDLDTSITELE